VEPEEKRLLERHRRILLVEPEGKRLLERLRHRQEDTNGGT
jgi:hypothetical protein